MKIPSGKYTIDSFLDYLVKNTDKVFKTGDERKWLKTHLLYVKQGWQEIFKNHGLEQWGDIWHFNTRDRYRSCRFLCISME